MNHEHGGITRKCHGRDVERPAVEEQRVAGATVYRRHLVHDAARNAGREVLRLLGDADEVGFLERSAGDDSRSKCERDFERGTRRQS